MQKEILSLEWPYLSLLLPFPWPINQLKCLRPSWFIFAPASHPILLRLTPASLPFLLFLPAYQGERNRRKHLPKIFNRHLCTTIPVAICCRLASPCRLFLSYVCVRIYIDFFCTFIKFSSGIRSRISTAPLLALTVCFLCYFPANKKRKKVSLSISRIMHNNNTKKLKKNTQLWSWTWIQRAWWVGGFAAATVTTTTATTICGKWLP